MLLEYHDVNYFVLILLSKQLNISACPNSCSRKGKLRKHSRHLETDDYYQLITIGGLPVGLLFRVCYSVFK